jgi:dTMP kinase
LFIDFEGIDGSGKTTISEFVAARLRERGFEVYHTREKGEYKSRISKSLRKVVRDPRNLGLLPRAEFLVYMARDAQVLEEKILPHLREGGVVISDRYFYSHVLLGEARGLAAGNLHAVMDQVCCDLLPDLVVYCDVDIHTSRVRKRIADIIGHDSGSFGRKGLSGLGLRSRMREGFLKLAREDPERWVVISNIGVTRDEVQQRVWHVVSSRLAAKRLIPEEDVAEDVTVASGPGTGIDMPDLRLPAGGPELARHFYAILDRHIPVDSRISAYHISGLDMPEADSLREKLKTAQPELVAHGLQGVRSQASWALRRELVEREPGYVARSLKGYPMEGEALEMRTALKKAAPLEVAKSLGGLECELSAGLREELFTGAPEGILASIKGLDTHMAWEFRDRCGKKLCPEALAESLEGLDTERAWKVRHKLLDKYTAWVLRGLGPCDSEAAWDLRRQYVFLAPKLVARSLAGMESERAWEMREAIGDAAKEVLDSIKYLDSAVAWSVRGKLADIYPSTAVSSVGKTVDSEGAWTFRTEMTGKHHDDLLLLKHVVEALSLTGRLAE